MLFYTPKRFEGQYAHYGNHGSTTSVLPSDNNKVVAGALDDTEVITRIYHVLHTFGQWDLNKIDFNKTFEDQGFDSLETIAILTSIEHEFHFVFEDNVFDNM